MSQEATPIVDLFLSEKIESLIKFFKTPSLYPNAKFEYLKPATINSNLLSLLMSATDTP